jgi:hypothetical protein
MEYHHTNRRLTQRGRALKLCGQDTGSARLIRWKNWVEFSKGNWEDLSDRLPKAEFPPVPYVLSAHGGSLCMGVSSVRINQPGCSYGDIFEMALDGGDQ